MRTEFSAELTAAGVVVTGEIDMATAPALREALTEAVHAVGNALTVDLAGVRYLDSAAVAVLYDFVGGGLTLVVRPGSPPEWVLRITGLTDVATIVEPAP